MPKGHYERTKAAKSKKLIKWTPKNIKELKALSDKKPKANYEDEPKIMSKDGIDLTPIEWKIDKNIPMPHVKRQTLADKYPTLFKLEPGQSVFVGNDKKELDKIMSIATRIGKEKHLTFYHRTRVKQLHGEEGFRVWCHDWQEPKPRKARTSKPEDVALEQQKEEIVT